MSIVAAVMFLSLAALANATDPAQAALTQAWEIVDQRGLKESASFDLKVEVVDPALGGEFFPSGPPPTRSSGPGGIHPLARWTDAVASQGDRYCFASESFPTGPLATKPGPTLQFFDGHHGWIYEPRVRQATRTDASTATSRQGLGFYRDMVGWRDGSTTATRTTPGISGEPYRLDRLIPSGQYARIGSEVVNGLECVVFSRPGLDKVWLVPSLGWALARREWRWSPGGPLKRRITARDPRAITPGLWLPGTATMEIFGTPTTRPGRRVGVLQARLDAATIDIPPGQFTPSFPDGTLITDRDTGATTRVGPPPGPNSRLGRALGPVFHPIPWWRRPWVAWAGGAGLAVIGAAWTVRRQWVD